MIVPTTITPELRISDADRARFEQYVLKSDACWTWLGGRNRQGYGAFWLLGRTLPAHRVAHWIATGRDPGAALVCHRCDSPPCVRPDHLFLGAASENSADMVAKGRQARCERNAAAQLTEAQVVEIREASARGESTRALAGLYVISRHTVSLIVRGLVWRGVAGPIRDLAAQRRLTPEEVSGIRAARAAGRSIREAAEDFGTSYATARRVIRGDRYS